MSNLQIATYNGRKYKLVWQGKTKFGQRAKLQFFDGSKEFWVDASRIDVSDAGPSPMERVYGRGRFGRLCRCSECGGWKAPGDPCGEPCD